MQALLASQAKPDLQHCRTTDNIPSRDVIRADMATIRFLNQIGVNACNFLCHSSSIIISKLKSGSEN